MDVYVNGKKIALAPSDFRAQGGEGSVYVKKEVAYKIFTDPAKAVPPAKIAELAVLTQPEILRPQDVLRDRAGTLLGYSMRAMPDAFPLCRTFTRTFCDQQGLTPESMRHLVRQLQQGVAHVHANGLLLVDLNETNFLVDAAFQKVFFIDVDSYQTPHFPATALMETVRDRHSTGFSMDTDWFAFAIVSFQMFVGIHPYKGKHPDLKTLDARMQANVSVLNPSVAVPDVCPPLSILPPALRDWYESVLENGARGAPPQEWKYVSPTVFAPSHHSALSGTGLFHIEELETFDDDIIGCKQGIVITPSGIVYKGRIYSHADIQIGVLPRSGGPVAAWAEGHRIHFTDLAQNTDILSDVAGEAVFSSSEGQLYVKQEGALLEVEFHVFPSGLRIGTRLAASVMPQATLVGNGVLLQNMVGAWYATLPEAGGRAPQVRLPELDGAQIVEARYQGRVLMITTHRQGSWEKLIFRFDAAQGYDIRRAEVATGGVNFVVLSTGICLHLTDEGVLEIFPNRRGAGEMRTLTDPSLSADCHLLANGAQALFARGRTLYRFSVKKNA